jgi:hypothetical protein
MLINLTNSSHLFVKIQTYKKSDLTISFYAKAAGDIIFSFKTCLHQNDFGAEITFAILKTNYKGNENRINALFSERILFLLEEKELKK